MASSARSLDTVVTPQVWTAARSPYQMGLVRLPGSDNCLTFVVKRTFSTACDGELQASAMQLPLSLDQRAIVSGREVAELEYASDFAPFKALADVLFVGHAYAPAPASAIAVGVYVDTIIAKQLDARAAVASSRIPLLAPHLHVSGAPARLGPTVSPNEHWRHDERSSGFGFARFNVAPDDQRVAYLGPGTRVTLDGLSPSIQRRTVLLPEREPKLYLMLPGQTPRRVALVCDTLWIHTDQQLCTLTWRGVVRVEHECTELHALVVDGRRHVHLDPTVPSRFAAASWSTAREAGPSSYPPPPTSWVAPRFDRSQALPMLQDEVEEETEVKRASKRLVAPPPLPRATLLPGPMPSR